MTHHLPQLVAELSLGQTILAGLLWAGLGGLTIALVLMMVTRWGQARPLSKCVALSIYAHVLLMTYAYGTKLVIPAPSQGEDAHELVHLHLVAADDAQEQTSDPASQARSATPAPWDELSVETPPDFSLAEPARVDTRVTPMEPAPLERTAEPPEALPSIEPRADTTDQELAEIEVDRETPEPQAVAAVPIEIPDVQRRDDVEPLAPAAAGPQRLSTTIAAADDGATASEIGAPEAGAKLHELTELLATTSVADALAARRDRLDTNAAQQLGGGAATSGDEGEAETLAPAAAVYQRLSRRTPRRLADGEPVPELYRLRVAPDRKRMARKLGATRQSDEAVEAALRWLAISQSEDGRWSARQFGAGQERKVLGHDRQGAGADADTGITGLAVLSMLGAGHTHLEGPYRENVQRGLEYLVREQRDDGSLAGPAKLYAMMYCHGMAALALSEAYAMTGDHRLEPYVRKAADFTIRAQHGSTGGWRYLPGDPGDMSQFGWQVMVLRSSELAGVEVPERTRAGMLRFLHNNTSGRFRGLASYRTGERASRTMTAEAYACRVFLGLEWAPDLTEEAAAFILEEVPNKENVDFYYWYYGSLAMFQLQDERWRTWNEALQRELIGRQVKAGDQAGSYDTDEVWSGYGGRVYTTSMAALCLEVYYRYLPVYAVSTASDESLAK